MVIFAVFKPLSARAAQAGAAARANDFEASGWGGVRESIGRTAVLAGKSSY